MRALQDDRRAVAVDDFARRGESVGRNLLALPAEQPRRLALVRRQDEFLPLRRIISVGAPVPVREHRKRVGVDHETSARAGEEPRDDDFGRNRDAEPHADHRDVGLRRHARRRQLRERRLGNEPSGRNARGVGNDELHQPRPRRASSEARDDRRMDVVTRSADDRHGADRILVGIHRTGGKRL